MRLCMCVCVESAICGEVLALFSKRIGTLSARQVVMKELDFKAH